MLSASPAVALNLSLRLLPGLAKSVAFLLVILNVRSLPLVWHLKVFWPLTRLWWHARRARIRKFLLSSPTSKNDVHEFRDDLVPIGQKPLDHMSVTKAWAGPDDCDYNWHLSNSSYPKVLDLARTNSCLNIFPSFVLARGMVALAGTHFQFLREIPMFARYEVRSQIVGWDHKWLYVVHRFVSHHKPASRRHVPAISDGPGLKTDNASPSSTPTPSDSSTDLRAHAARAAVTREPEPDGATLHCVSVNVVVFKYGGITVPPALVLAGEGFGATHAQGAAARARAVEVGRREMRELYRGAWRTVPEGPDRWWDAAMHGLEDRIERRVAQVIGVRAGLEGALEVRGL